MMSTNNDYDHSNNIFVYASAAAPQKSIPLTVPPPPSSSSFSSPTSESNDDHETTTFPPPPSDSSTPVGGESQSSTTTSNPSSSTTSTSGTSSTTTSPVRSTRTIAAAATTATAAGTAAGTATRMKRFITTGPILTVTLKDPFANDDTYSEKQQHYIRQKKKAAKHQQQKQQQQGGPTGVTSQPASPGVGPGIITTGSHTTISNGQDVDEDASFTSSSSSSSSTTSIPNQQEQQQHRSPRLPRRIFRSIYSKFSSRSTSAASHVLGIPSLAPTILWSIRSNDNVKPLPNYIPHLHSMSLSTGYVYDDLKTAPSFVEGNFKFYKRIHGLLPSSLSIIRGSGSSSTATRSGSDFDLNVDVSPSYEVRSKKGSLLVRMSGGRSSVIGGDGVGSCTLMAKFVTKGKKTLEYICASYKINNLPFSSTIGSLSITPSYDYRVNEQACTMVGKSASGRTAAILDLNWNTPKLAVKHALDERNTISPEISLYNAKILYNWDIQLDSGSIRTRVDPTSDIQVTWIDQTRNGKWVTDFRLPLVGVPGPLAGDLRVRRQFSF